MEIEDEVRWGSVWGYYVLIMPDFYGVSQRKVLTKADLKGK